MTTYRIGHLLAAMLSLLLCACQTAGPSAEDVAADRARWRAVLTETADGVIDEQEAPLNAQLLADWDAKLTADEKAAGDVNSPKKTWETMLRVYGVAAVQVVLGPKLLEKAPQVYKLLDKNQDGVLDEQELLGLDPTDNATAIVVVQALYDLIKHKP